jgi:hypothetical protein
MLPGVFIFKIMVGNNVIQNAENEENRYYLGKKEDAGQPSPGHLLQVVF